MDELIEAIGNLLERWETTADNLDEMNFGDFNRAEAIRNCADELAQLTLRLRMKYQNDLPSSQA